MSCGRNDSFCLDGNGKSFLAMAISDVFELFFLPPLALARLGGSDTPLESFRWADDVTIEGGHHTVIEPAVTLRVDADGAAFPYMPNAIEFRDAGKLRPVAPFFELWVRMQEIVDHQPVVREQPLTLELLRRLGISTGALRYRITLGNKKAERRTLSPACGFLGRVEATGDDHWRHSVLAWSPHNPGVVPLVDPSRPIPLGHFQVLRPIPASNLGVDLSVLRVLHAGQGGGVRTARRDYRDVETDPGRPRPVVESIARPDVRDRPAGKPHPEPRDAVVGFYPRPAGTGRPAAERRIRRCRRRHRPVVSSMSPGSFCPRIGAAQGSAAAYWRWRKRRADDAAALGSR